MSDDMDMDELPPVEAEDEDDRPPRAERYLSMIRDAEKAFQPYQDKVTTIERLYADLERLASAEGDRQFQLFWANMCVLGPTIYQRPPKPVVQQRFRDRDPVPREAAEMLERALSWDIEDDDLHETLKLVRDDLAIAGRGVPWVLDDGSCLHVDRLDFAHDPARKWSEVGWVARRAYLTREAFSARFPDADIRQANFEHRSATDDGMAAEYQTTDKKAEVWEMWHRSEGVVLWVSDGVEEVLDVQPPLFDVKGFFPCPQPAYATLKRRTLIPVPDYIYYRDQLDEINELTARISSLSESLRLKGFYASGASEIGEAIEAAMKATDNKALLIPVSTMAALGGASMKDAIVWMPVREVAEVITSLVALRKQMIEDVYEISGISDIMRGETVASETATAQNLKAQYGSVRVRERQEEMVRVARDVIRIKAEVYAEMKGVEELATMAQMKLPTSAEVQQAMAQHEQMTAQHQAMQQQAQMMAERTGQQPPEMPAPPPPPFDMEKTVTLDQIDALLKDQRIRPFVLEVESDSTIAPNEIEEKQSRTEFVQVIGQYIQTAGQMVAAAPETAKFAVEVMKFAAGAFRAGRELDAALDEFAETIEAGAQQQLAQRGQPSPEQQAEQAKAQMEGQKLQVEQAKVASEAEARQVNTAMTMDKMRAEIEKLQSDMEISKAQAAADLDKTLAEVEKIRAETARLRAEPEPMVEAA